MADTSIVAQAPSGIFVAALLERLFGVQVLRGVLVNGGLRPHESSADADLEEDRGFEILVALAQIFMGTTDSSRCRPLTPGEQTTLAFNNQLFIKNIDQVRVCNGGFLGIKGYLITPNGNIYVGPNSGVPFRADYSIEPNLDFRAIIVHELFHVFQNRNRGCTASNGCILALRIVSLGNYCYTPLVPGKPFYNYNLEQEAELVADRYRLRQGSNAQLPCNRSNAPTLEGLEQLLPKIFF